MPDPPLLFAPCCPIEMAAGRGHPAPVFRSVGLTFSEEARLVTELNRYWNRRKRRAILFIVSAGAALVASYAILICSSQLIAWLSSTWPGANSTERLQILSFAVNAALTTILVGATCLYAWLTWRMVRELVESRRVGKRPGLVIDLGRLEINRPEGETHVAGVPNSDCKFRRRAGYFSGRHDYHADMSTSCRDSMADRRCPGLDP